MKLEDYCKKFAELYEHLQNEHGTLDCVHLQTCIDNKVRVSVEFVNKPDHTKN